MYRIEEYGQMIADKVRTSSYAHALERTVRPHSTVLDLGAATGILSLLACQHGARKVYAVEVDDVIGIAREIARANGYADRIEFIQQSSMDIVLPEKVDVIVSDMHGSMPLYAANVASIIDARKRMLAGGGVLIPKRESLWAAVVEAPEEFGELVDPWSREAFNLDMGAARRAVTNSIKKIAVEKGQLLSSPRCWGTIDYAMIESPSHSAEVSFPVEQSGIGHGLVLWFDSILADGIGFSNAPGQPEMIFGSLFLPWNDPVPIEVGDTVSVRLQARFMGAHYVWSWESTISAGSPARNKAHFRQSTFWGTPIDPKRLHRRAGDYRPVPGIEGQIDASILGEMDGTRSIEEIARIVMERFPDRFQSLVETLARVGDLSESYDAAQPDNWLKR